jgi:hypothetical protein
VQRVWKHEGIPTTKEAACKEGGSSDVDDILMERQWVRVDMAVLCIRAFHPRVFLSYYSHCGNERTDDTLFFLVRVVRFKCHALEALWTGPGRVLWMSSFAAQAHTFDADEWQLMNSTMPY